MLLAVASTPHFMVATFSSYMGKLSHKMLSLSPTSCYRGKSALGCGYPRVRKRQCLMCELVLKLSAEVVAHGTRL